MTAKLISGTRIAKEVRAEVAEGVRALRDRHHGVTPGLAVVLVGDDPASATYVRNKGRACEEAGIFSETFLLSADTSQAELLALVRRLNDDSRFHGLLVQLPLPPQINESVVLLAVDPDKDVDGLHPFNVGKLATGAPVFVPCTPAGIQQLLLRSGYDLASRMSWEVVVDDYLLPALDGARRDR